MVSCFASVTGRVQGGPDAAGPAGPPGPDGSIGTGGAGYSIRQVQQLPPSQLEFGDMPGKRKGTGCSARLTIATI